MCITIRPILLIWARTDREIWSGRAGPIECGSISFNLSLQAWNITLLLEKEACLYSYCQIPENADLRETRSNRG